MGHSHQIKKKGRYASEREYGRTLSSATDAYQIAVGGRNHGITQGSLLAANALALAQMLNAHDK